jgi:FkbM family methyltransferase
MPTKTLDTFCEEIKLKKIDVLKIDVEGFDAQPPVSFFIK